MAGQIEKILVVDDNDGHVLFWDMLLPEFKLTVFKARTGAEGIEIMDKESIPVAIIAWELPSMPGAVFVQKARSTKKRRRMPIVIYSKRMGPDDVAFAKELGLDTILSVPLDKAAARQMIQQVLDRENALSPVENKLRKMEDQLAEGRPSEVLKMVGPDVSKKGPHLPRYKTIIAETFLMMGQIDKADKAIKEALEADPDYMPAKYVQARIFTTAGKHDEAIAILDAMSTSNPKNIQTLLNLGSAYVSADRLDDAKQTIAAVKDLDPEILAVKDNEGKVALKEGNIPLAAELLAHTENGDDIARFYNSLGISLVAKGNFDKGIETYQSALKILGNKAKLHLLYFNLALAYRKKEDISSSLSYLCESYISDPSFEQAYAAIARSVDEMKKASKSLPMNQIQMVKNARKKYFEANPEIAAKIKAKIEERTKAAS